MADSSVDVTSKVVDFPAAPLRVLGPPGSGKTRLLIERYRALRTKGLDVHILTYTKDSYRRLTEAILEKNSVALGYDPVVQYPRLAAEIIALSGEKQPSLIGAVEEQLLLDSVIAEHWSNIKSGLRSICRTDRFAHDVLEVFHALLQNGIGSDDASRLAKLKNAGSEIEDVLMLYGEFCNALSTRNLTTHSGISWDAVRLCEKGCHDHPITKAAVVLVEDFQDIDPGQFELLATVAAPGGPVAVNVFGDPMGSVFGYRGTEERFLLEEFPKCYRAETVHLNARCRDAGAEGPAMEALLRETLGRDADKHLPLRHDEPAGPSGDRRIEKSFSLEIVGDELDEAYTLGARIARLIASGGCRPDDIAVITNEKNRYAHVLQSTFRQHAIPLDTGATAVGVFDDFVYALLLLVDAPDDDVAARSIVTSPLFAHLQQVIEDGPTPPTGIDGDDDHGVLRQYVTGLAAELRSSPARDWMNLLVEKCLRPACAAFRNGFNDDAMFGSIGRLLEQWRGYADAVDKLGRRADIRTFVELSGLFGAQTTAPRLLPDTVGLYSCREAKGLFFPIVFVVGCSDLLFPSASDSQNLVPVARLENLLAEVYAERNVSIYAARSAPRVLREQHHFLYIGLTRATSALHVTAPRNFGGDEFPAPCALLENTVSVDHLCSTPHDVRIPPQIRFARAWTTGGYDDAVVESLLDLSPTGAVWNPEKSKKTPVPVNRFTLSKSSIEMFLTCQRQFFYRKLLRIPQEPTEPARLGTLFHSVMAGLGQRFKTKTRLQAGATPDLIRRLIDDALRQDGTVEPSSFFERAVREYLEQMIGGVLGLDAALEDDYRISGVEESLRFSYKDYAFIAKVDRIEDHAAGDVFVVDFKTGEIPKTGRTHRKYVLKALEEPAEADWQIPLYLWAVNTRDGRFPGAFRFMAVKPGEEPRAITLYARPDEGAVPAAAGKSGPESYLLEGEVEQIMERAAATAAEIFTPRTDFERTADEKPCRWCEFAQLCQRENQWG